MITADSPFRSPPRISRDKFVAVMVQAGSPWADQAPTLYDLLEVQGHDPAVWLGIGTREHGLGTDKNSVLYRNDTRSWTNARTVRLPGLGYEIITDSVRKSQYVRYHSVADSLRDGMYRITDPSYVYVHEGRTTIGQVLGAWTEDPGPYTDFVVAKMNEWSTPVAGDDPRFQWTPDTSEFGYPQGTHGRNGQPIELLILHITVGTDSQGWLLGGNGSSTHYLTKQDGSPRAQHVAEADAAWTPGSRDYALRSINVEVEMLHTTDWTDAIMRETARTVAPIMARHNIPAVYLGHDNGPGKRGMIGHRDVPDGHGGWGGSSHHDDPGANFDWTTFQGYVAAELAGGSTPAPAEDAVTFAEVPYKIVLGFKGFWNEVNPGLRLYIMGLPKGNERAVTTVPSVASAQPFDRCGWLVYQPNENPAVTVAQKPLRDALNAEFPAEAA